MTSLTALVIEEDLQVRRLIRRTLSRHGFRLVEVATPAEGLREAEKRRPDILLLDLQPRTADAVGLIRRLREWSQVPILALAASGQESQGTAALEVGADDYVSRPFGKEELLTRVQVAMRRAVQAGSYSSTSTSLLTLGELQVDLSARRLLVSDREIRLTPIQYRLLIVLIKNVGKVVPYRQLLKDIWGPTHVKQTQYLRVCMTHLRRKLEAEPKRPRYLLTVPRIGYRLAAV